MFYVNSRNHEWTSSVTFFLLKSDTKHKFHLSLSWQICLLVHFLKICSKIIAEIIYLNIGLVNIAHTHSKKCVKYSGMFAEIQMRYFKRQTNELENILALQYLLMHLWQVFNAWLDLPGWNLDGRMIIWAPNVFLFVQQPM